jgi:hypothetical protein
MGLKLSSGKKRFPFRFELRSIKLLMKNTSSIDHDRLSRHKVAVG